MVRAVSANVSRLSSHWCRYRGTGVTSHNCNKCIYLTYNTYICLESSVFHIVCTKLCKQWYITSIHNTIDMPFYCSRLSVFRASLLTAVPAGTRASVVIVRQPRSHYTTDREPGEPWAAANEPFAPWRRRRPPVHSRPACRLATDGSRPTGSRHCSASSTVFRATVYSCRFVLNAQRRDDATSSSTTTIL